MKSKINSYNKEIISIIAIILALAPLIVINVSTLKDFTINNLLVINGCLIIGISTIFPVVVVAFFELKRQHWLLIISLLLGIGLILLSFKF